MPQAHVVYVIGVLICFFGKVVIFELKNQQTIAINTLVDIVCQHGLVPNSLKVFVPVPSKWQISLEKAHSELLSK